MVAVPWRSLVQRVSMDEGGANSMFVGGALVGWGSPAPWPRPAGAVRLGVVRYRARNRVGRAAGVGGALQRWPSPGWRR